EGLEKATNEAFDESKRLALEARQINKDAGKNIGRVEDAIRESGKTFNLSDDIARVEAAIAKLRESDHPNAIKDVEFLETYLKNLKLGKEVTEEVQSSVWQAPKKIKTAEQKLIDE